MKNIFCNLSVFVLLSLLLLSTVSCTKTSSSTSVPDQLVGNWKMYEEYADTNMNHLQDASDYHQLLDSFNIMITVNKDGTGKESSSTEVLHGFTWQLLNNNKNLVIYDSLAAKVISYDIISINSSAFTILDTTQSVYVWETAHKQ